MLTWKFSRYAAVLVNCYDPSLLLIFPPRFNSSMKNVSWLRRHWWECYAPWLFVGDSSTVACPWNQKQGVIILYSLQSTLLLPTCWVLRPFCFLLLLFSPPAIVLSCSYPMLVLLTVVTDNPRSHHYCHITILAILMVHIISIDISLAKLTTRLFCPRDKLSSTWKNLFETSLGSALVLSEQHDNRQLNHTNDHRFLFFHIFSLWQVQA